MGNCAWNGTMDPIKGSAAKLFNDPPKA